MAFSSTSLRFGLAAAQSVRDGFHSILPPLSAPGKPSPSPKLAAFRGALGRSANQGETGRRLEQFQARPWGTTTCSGVCPGYASRKEKLRDLAAFQAIGEGHTRGPLPRFGAKKAAEPEKLDPGLSVARNGGSATTKPASALLAPASMPSRQTAGVSVVHKRTGLAARSQEVESPEIQWLPPLVAGGHPFHGSGLGKSQLVTSILPRTHPHVQSKTLGRGHAAVRFSVKATKKPRRGNNLPPTPPEYSATLINNQLCGTHQWTLLKQPLSPPDAKRLILKRQLADRGTCGSRHTHWKKWRKTE